MLEISNLQNVAVPSLPFSVAARGKWVAYIVLILLALAFRASGIDVVPMSEQEAARALSAYQMVHPGMAGTAQPAESAIAFWLQTIAFATFGGGEGAARLGGVLGGLVLILMPLLFEKQLGTVRTFLLSLFLACSPVAFVSARTGDPVIWSVVAGLAVVAAAQRFWSLRDISGGYALIILIFVLLFLVGSSGMLLGMILVVSAISALAWTIWQAPLERDTPGDEVVTEAREAWQQLPIGRAVLAAAAVIVAVSTGLMTYPGGLSMAGASLAIITGSIGSQIEPVPAFYALRALLIYEPMLLLLAFASILTVIRTTTQFLDRLMLMWLMVGSVLLLLYQGQTAGHALLLVVPLAWLVSALLDRILTSDPLSIMQGEYFIYARNRQNLLNWLVASVVFLLLIMGGVHLQEVGRGLQSAPTDGSLSVYMEASFAAFRASATWAAITAMLMVVVYLLIGSYRGAQTAFQGFVLGFSVFMLVFNVGSGWNTAVVHAANPLEFWYGSTPAADTYLLRQTLVEIARRDTSGFPEIPVTIVTNADAGLREDGLVAWLVRDYPNARFVPSLTDALRDEIILLAETPEDPDLGGSYVGQRFGVRQRWAIDQQLRSADWLSWWMQRRTANGGMTVDHAVLWLRADVYDGVPADERPQG